MYQRWYYELTLDHIEQVSHLSPHLRLGWANTKGYVSYPGGGEKWGGNGVGDDLYSFGFDGSYLWTGGRYTLVNPQVLPEDGELNVKFRSLRFLGIYFFIFFHSFFLFFFLLDPFSDLQESFYVLFCFPENVFFLLSRNPFSHFSGLLFRKIYFSIDCLFFL